MCGLRRRRSGRRPARSPRAALAPTLARTSVRCEAARVRRKIAQSDPRVMPFFSSYSLRNKYDVIKNPPDSWSDKAKNALRAITFVTAE